MKWMWALFFSIVLFGMWMIYDAGIQPKSVRVIKPSYFAEPTEFGRLIYKVLKPRIAMHKVLVIGRQPGVSDHESVLEGFLRAAHEDGYPYNTLIYETMQKDLAHVENLTIEPIDANETVLLERITQKLKEQRVLIYVHAENARQGPDMLAQKIQNMTSQKTYSLIFLNAAFGESAEALAMSGRLIGECSEIKKVHPSLACLAMKQSLVISKSKKTKWDKFIGIMNQEGEKEYIAFTHPAQQK